MKGEQKVFIVEINGRALKVVGKLRKSGSHLILLLHGLGCAKESFDDAFTNVSLRDYSLCAFDFPGFGESDKPDDFSYDLEVQAEIARQLLLQVPYEKLSIVGHSMGGAIGVLLMQKLQDASTTFINVEGNLVAEDCGLVSRQVADQSPKAFVSEGYVAFRNILATSDRYDFSRWLEWFDAADARAMHTSAQSLVQWSDNGDLLPAFHSLPRKAYIYGDKDPKGYILQQIPDVQQAKIAQAGHFMMVEQPDTFYSAVARLL